MRKTLYLLALLLVAQIGWAIDPSTTLTTYYASIDGKSTNASDDLRKTLCTIISTGYTSIGYSSLPSQIYGASSNPSDFVNGTGSSATMEDIYSSKPYKMSDSGSSASTCGTGWNKEHTVPQSWFNESSPMKSDAFHVYPTDIKMNSVRSNYPYGETSAAMSCSSWGYGRLGTSTFPGYTGTVFDPGEGGEHGSYKGDLARTYFYMATRYRTTNFTNGSGGTSFTYSGGVANLTDYMKSLMLKWHREDPVSPKELNRNNAIYAHQHNRNPFIDYPELVEYIWGTKVGQVVALSALVSAYDGETPPPGPQPVTPKYGVTWSVNGGILRVDSIAENGAVSLLPSTPVSCSQESNIFMGWTNAPISGTTDDAPAVLYTNASNFPAVTEDVTYYAVFARLAEMEPSLPASFTFDADHQEGWTNTGKVTGSYWLLKEGLELISPEMDLAGLTSIQMTMRTYGGASNNTVHIIANNQEIGTLVAASNTLAEKTWTNNQTLSGIAAIHFTANYTASNAGVGFSAVTINGTGTADVYCRFITSCQEPSEVINIVSEETAAKKIIVNGQLFIQTPDGLFNLQGQRVK